MTTKAYLVIMLGVSDDKPFPCFLGARIFSAPAGDVTTSFEHRYVDVTYTEGEDFQAAKNKLVDLVATNPFYVWLRPWIEGASTLSPTEYADAEENLHDEARRRAAEWKVAPQGWWSAGYNSLIPFNFPKKSK